MTLLLALPSVLILSAGIVNANPLITLEDAAILAQAHHSGLIIEVDLEDDARIWDVEFADGLALDIDARSGNVLDTDRRDELKLNVPSGVITIWNAVATASSVVPGSEPIEAELNFDEGRLYWEIEFRNNTEVEIDALSGAILDVEHDD